MILEATSKGVAFCFSGGERGNLANLVYFQSMITSNCLNCNSSLEAEDKYCFYCGQQSHQHRLSLAHLGHEAVHFLTHADKGIFFLLKMLIIAPGKVAREYIAGKRRKYFSPLNFFFIVAGLYVIAMTSFNPLARPVSEQQEYLETLKKRPASIENTQEIIAQERRMKSSMFMGKYANIVNMIVTPIFALIFFLFYARGPFNYTEHLVTNLYAAGLNGLVFSLIVAPVLIPVERGKQLQFFIVLGFLLWETVYRAVMYYGLMNRKTSRSFFKALMASMCATIVWMTLSTGLITLYNRTGFWL